MFGFRHGELFGDFYLAENNNLWYIAGSLVSCTINGITVIGLRFN